jgi:hypothetical protein
MQSITVNTDTKISLINKVKTKFKNLLVTFEKFDDCWSEYASLAEKSIFVYAFKLGMRLAIEVLN